MVALCSSLITIKEKEDLHELRVSRQQMSPHLCAFRFPTVVISNMAVLRIFDIRSSEFNID
jgi:hypothetical protein